MRYDGFGINADDGQRLFTAQRKHASDGGGFVIESDDERHRLGTLLAAAPDLLAAAIHFEGCTYFEDHDGLDGCPLCAKHRRAVAKAQGG